MIVNPQFFNYRLIIGSLVIAIVILSSFSYSSYSELTENQVFIEQEKGLVENELSEMISSYDGVKIENKSIRRHPEITKSKISSILDSVKRLKPSASLISKYKSQIRWLKKENARVLAMVNTLEVENKTLKQETVRFESEISKKEVLSRGLKIENRTLSKRNTDLKLDLYQAKNLILTNVEATGVKRITSKRIVATKLARKVNKFHVCFTILNNKFTDPGEKELYIQVLDSKMNVIADKGTVHFGKKSLIYSEKKTVFYSNEELTVCSIIEKRPK
ncbi:hypothetical protein N7U66_14140 [Lacinutrix neustonica]|uniref:Uncharacterized protein n=1 Tax=Lacinutrix neustonica TaxID=2980107 RepID=A0A9E8SCG1_9FLAO|nr:hypothetical protein [Lacinutrix neustonica]WAC01248.1 hypothetical protein N7U66_14140 [Lacinutrix neustonica]